MIILVTGDRNGYDDDLLWEALEPYAEVGNILIVGGCGEPGEFSVDEQARDIWHYEFQLPYVVMPAPWDRAGRAAGPMRNGAMLVGNALAPHAQLVPDIVLAFHHNLEESKGTKNCIEQAERRGIEVVLHE